jgi:hypothetical protein
MIAYYDILSSAVGQSVRVRGRAGWRLRRMVRQEIGDVAHVCAYNGDAGAFSRVTEQGKRYTARAVI